MFTDNSFMRVKIRVIKISNIHRKRVTYNYFLETRSIEIEQRLQQHFAEEELHHQIQCLTHYEYYRLNMKCATHFNIEMKIFFVRLKTN